MKIVSGELMSKIDRFAIDEIGIPGTVLMENAGKGVFLKFLEKFNPDKNSSILVVCGKGNNGGDGFVVARYLYNYGFNFDIILLTKGTNLKGDAKINFNICSKLGIKIYEIETEEDFFNIVTSKNYNFIFDAILGTGLNSEVKTFYKKIISYINESMAKIISVDIPSGLHSEKGIPLGVSVNADLTCTFAFKKIGLSTYPGALYSGEVEVIDISIPNKIPFNINYFEIDDKLIKEIYQDRAVEAHKGIFGHVLVLGGSIGFSGAPILCAKGALVSGCGLVTSIVPKKINQIVEASFTEGMTFPIDILSYDRDELLKFINSKDAIIIGPGIGQTKDVEKFILDILDKIEIPKLIDADGLNILSKHLEIFENIRDVIITPHPGEMSRLTGKNTKDIQNNRIYYAKTFAEKYNIVVVLKGYKTVIASREKIYICPKGNSAIATAGSGDVLSGIIGSFVAQKYSLTEAAILGTYLHAFAGEVAANNTCNETVIANDILKQLHYAFKITLL